VDSREFAMNFLFQQAGKIADVIYELSKEDKTDKEKIMAYANRIKELSAFAAPDHLMRPFFNQLIAEEEKANDSKSSI